MHHEQDDIYVLIFNKLIKRSMLLNDVRNMQDHTGDVLKVNGGSLKDRSRVCRHGTNKNIGK